MSINETKSEEFHKTALIIGSGVGGLSLGIRLQSLGFKTTILEKLDGPGGRAYTKKIKGFVFKLAAKIVPKITPVATNIP